MNDDGPSSRAWRVVSLVLLALAVTVTVVPSSHSIEGDARIYVEAAESIGEGSYASASEPSGVPRYPPGFPLMLVPFVALWGDDGARVASLLLGTLLVGLVWLAAGRIGGSRAAAVAALLWTASPMLTDYSTDVMSDPAGAVFVMIAFLAAMSGRWLLVGLTLGWGGWIRLIHTVFLVGVGRRRSAWLAAVLVLVPLAAFQLRTYGRLAGYDGGQAQFALSNVFGGTPLLYMDRSSPWPNWQFFPGLLWGLRAGLVPMLPLFAGLELVARRAEPSARLAAWAVLMNLLVYLPFYYQAPRFVLPAACLVVVFAAAGVLRVVDSVLAGHLREDQPSGRNGAAPASTRS